SRPIGARRPDRRPTTPRRRPARFRTASGGGAERAGRRREELHDGRTRPGTGAVGAEHRRPRRGFQRAHRSPTPPHPRCQLHVARRRHRAVGERGRRSLLLHGISRRGWPTAGVPGPETEGHVWRGTLEAAALREFLADVAWGALDELLVDLPPGVQRFQELTELLPARPAVLAVTIPTPESRDAVRRALRAANDGKATLLGVVENMVGGPFVGNAADELATEFGIPVLARVPFHPGEDVWENVVSKLQ